MRLPDNFEYYLENGISKKINPLIETFLTFVLVLSLFYLIILIPYALSRNIKITFFGINYMFIFLGAFLGYILFYIFDKYYTIKNERTRKIKNIFREI